jgi:hypothetical protein
MSMDLNKMVNNALAEMTEAGYVQQVVKKELEKTVASVVNDLIGGYRSEFKVSLENHVKENLNVDMNYLNLSGYNVLLLNTVQEILDDQIQTEGIERVKKELTKMFSPMEKKEWKLSEIIEKMKEDANEDHEKDGDSISYHYDDSFSLGIHVHFDPEENETKYGCKYMLYISRDRKNEVSGRLDSLRIGDRELTNKQILNGLYGFDKFLFQLYATGATIIVDNDEVYEDYGYDD